MGLLKLIRDFRAPVDAATAAELRRQLGQLEQNVSDMGDALSSAAMQPLSVIEQDGRSNALTVGPGQSLGIASAVARVQLTRPTVADAGKFLAICRGAGAGPAVVVQAPARSTINGAASFSFAATGVLRLIYCDGVNYWTGP